jgi:hypothetical protein
VRIANFPTCVSRRFYDFKDDHSRFAIPIYFASCSTLAWMLFWWSVVNVMQDVYIYIYVYVCMYVCMYVCIYIYIYRFMHPVCRVWVWFSFLNSDKHNHVNAVILCYAYSNQEKYYTYTHTYMYVYIYICIHTYVHTFWLYKSDKILCVGSVVPLTCWTHSIRHVQRQAR